MFLLVVCDIGNMAHYFSCYKTTFIAFKVFSHLVRILLRLIAMWSSMSSSCFYRREEQVEHNEIGLSYPSRAVLQLPKVKERMLIKLPSYLCLVAWVWWQAGNTRPPPMSSRGQHQLCGQTYYYSLDIMHNNVKLLSICVSIYMCFK